MLSTTSLIQPNVVENISNTHPATPQRSEAELTDPLPVQSPSGVLFGVAYYPEYHLTDRVETDLDLMQRAGINVIRVGESVWSTWEPQDGEFDLDWLAPVLDAAR